MRTALSRLLPTILTVILLVACGAPDPAPPADPMDQAAAPAPVGPTLAELAGAWQGETTLEGVENPVPMRTTSDADGSNWTMMLEGRDPITLTVSIDGQDIIMVSDGHSRRARGPRHHLLAVVGAIGHRGRPAPK